MDKTETEVIDIPQTNKEHLKYAWKGVKMVASSSATLAWRGVKATYRTVAGWIHNARKGKEGSDTNANCTETSAGPAPATAAA